MNQKHTNRPTAEELAHLRRHPEIDYLSTERGSVPNPYYQPKEHTTPIGVTEAADVLRKLDGRPYAHLEQEIEHLRAELEKVKETCRVVTRLHDQEEQENQKLHDKIEQQAKRIEELEKDRERLDFVLNGVKCRVQKWKGYNDFSHQHDWTTLAFREAIDAAMQPKDGKE